MKVPAEESKVVTVRHVPFMLMLSPSWQSCRIEVAEEMVRVVPPSEELGFSCVTSMSVCCVSLCVIARWMEGHWRGKFTSYYLYYSCEHFEYRSD